MGLKKPLSSENIDRLTELVLKYVEVKSELIKLQIKENVFQIIASLVLAFMLLIFAFLILILLSTAVAGIINERLGSEFWGEIIVAGFYTIVLILLFLNRKKIINKGFVKFIASDHFNQVENSDDHGSKE